MSRFDIGAEDSSDTSDSTLSAKNDMLRVDDHMRAHLSAIVTTVVLFLTTHSESTIDNRGVFGASESICRGVGKDPRYLVSSLMDLLGTISVVIAKGRPLFEQFFDDERGPKTYPYALKELKQLSYSYQCFVEAAGKRSKSGETGLDIDEVLICNETFSGYQWHLLREMFYWSMTLEQGFKVEERWTTPMWDGPKGLGKWIDDQFLISCSLRGKDQYMGWFRLFVWKKIEKLDKVIKFMETDLPALRRAEGPKPNSRLESPAITTEMQQEDGRLITDFRELKSLKNVFIAERTRWEAILAARATKGHLHPRYTGFDFRQRTIALPAGTKLDSETRYPDKIKDLEVVKQMRTAGWVDDEKSHVGRRLTLELMPLEWRSETPEDEQMERGGLRAPRDGTLPVFDVAEDVKKREDSKRK